MKPVRRMVIAGLLLGAGGCTYTITDPVDGSILAKCHDGAFIGFCIAAVPPGHAVVSGAGIVPTINSGAAIASYGTTTGEMIAR